MAGAAAPAAGADGSWGPELQALSARLLAERRVNEVAAALREGLDEAASQFSYARARGLRSLCAAVRARRASSCAVPLLTRRPRRCRALRTASRTASRCARHVAVSRSLRSCALTC